MALPATLARFADAFDDYLFGPDCLPRISHHMALGTPEAAQAQ